MRLLYSGLVYLISPLVPLYLKKRARKNPDYLLHWNERFARNLIKPSNKPIIWLHSVSVGETRAMQMLVEIINSQLPKYQILITTMTPTGRATAKKLYPYAIIHYVPYDLPHCVTNFYEIFKPSLGIILETEIWPNLIHFANIYAVPLYLVNARLSDRSFKGYNRFKWALMPVLNKLSGILCQDKNSYHNFLKLGYRGDLQIVGNTKFDLVTNSDLAVKIKLFNRLFNNKRKIICFASSRDGEEKLFLEHIDFSNEILYLIIPRHPERFIIVEQLLNEKKIPYQKRSTNETIAIDSKVVIGDSLGEMLAYYAISHLAIIGGSFNDFGGQNPIEAIYMHKPVVFGPSMYNFADVAKNSLEFGCAIQLNNMIELSNIIDEMVNSIDEYNNYKQNCQKFIDTFQGASQKIFSIMQKVIVNEKTVNF